jgi:hypothetical protein
MKKLILLALTCTAIIMSNCTPSPSPGPATPTPTPTPTPTYSMTATETALVGDWIWDKTENYSAGVLTSITTSATPGYTLYAGIHMDLKSTLYMNTSYYTIYGYNMFNGDAYAPNISAAVTSSAWYVKNLSAGEYLYGISYVLTQGYLYTLNATTLITQAWVTGQTPNGTKVFYHK